jgi:polar amino acid transport system substrate-binding protein
MLVSDMKHLNISLKILFILVGAILAAPSALGEDGSAGELGPSPAASPDVDELVSFVKSAVAFAQEKGRETAPREFSDKNGSFVRGELYIYAYDFRGKNIAHPFKPDWTGEDKMNETDANGVLYIRNLVAAARGGEGFTYFIFSNPAHENRDEFKIGYAMKVDDEWWLGSGLYLPEVSAAFDGEEREDLVAFVEEALEFARKKGKDEAIAAFNDPSGEFTRDGSYIFAYDYEGTTLALPHQQHLLGERRIEAEDPRGVRFIQEAIDAARNGSRFLYYIYPDPEREMSPTLKLSLVADVDGTWFLGTRIYSGADGGKDG